MAMLNNQMVVYSNICHIIVMCWWPSELEDSMLRLLGIGWKSLFESSIWKHRKFFFVSHFELDTSLTHMKYGSEVSHHWSIAGPSLGNLCGIGFTHKSEINGYVRTSILLKSALMKLMMNIYPLVNEQSYWKLPFLVDLPPTFLWFSIVFCMFTRGYTII